MQEDSEELKSKKTSRGSMPPDLLKSMKLVSKWYIEDPCLVFSYGGEKLILI